MNVELKKKDPIMRILVDHGNYQFANIGDVAMLQSCLIRLRRLWPDAEIMVFTHDADRLATYCEGAKPIYRTFKRPPLFGRLPPKYSQVWDGAIPYLFGHFSLTKQQYAKAQSVVQAVRAADLVVAAGGGYLADSFYLHGIQVLGILSLAQRLGKPTAAFGLGIGPISERVFRLQARKVLPKLTVLGLRESLLSQEIALSLGVSPETIRITGDEALELVDKDEVAAGQALGINLRVAAYSGINSAVMAEIGEIIAKSAGMLNAPIMALPVSHGAGAGARDDLDSVRGMLGPNTTNAGVSLREISTPTDIVVAAAHCRAIVTGSYHAAVFGLAQGVPIIGLSKSAYYDGKFAGLKGLFPDACTVLSVDRPDFPAQLLEAIERSWDLPHPSREMAVLAATRQRTAGRDLYKQLYKLVERG